MNLTTLIELASGSDKPNPMHQFEISSFAEVIISDIFNFSITNSTLSMLAIAALVTAFVFISVAYAHLEVSGRIQSALEISYLFLRNTFVNTTGMTNIRYFSFAASLMLYVFIGNALGLIPGAFTVTSHISITLWLALWVFFLSLYIGIKRHGLKFFRAFCPHGTPLLLMPLVVPIELVSFVFRPISLSLRLAANMFVGHILLKVMTFFLLFFGGFTGVFVFIALTGITLLEILVAVLQAYVFFILTCVYLKLSTEVH